MPTMEIAGLCLPLKPQKEKCKNVSSITCLKKKQLVLVTAIVL
jgi:hypothetical protein